MQVGMRHFNIRKNLYHCPIVNLDKLWALVGEEVRQGGDCWQRRQHAVSCAVGGVRSHCALA